MTFRAVNPRLVAETLEFLAEYIPDGQLWIVSAWSWCSTLVLVWPCAEFLEDPNVKRWRAVISLATSNDSDEILTVVWRLAERAYRLVRGGKSRAALGDHNDREVNMDADTAQRLERYIQQLFSSKESDWCYGASNIRNDLQQNPAMREPIAHNARAIPRLVELLVTNENGNDTWKANAFKALHLLALHVPACQMRIVDALTTEKLNQVKDDARFQPLFKVLSKTPRLHVLLAAKSGVDAVVKLVEDAVAADDTLKVSGLMEALCELADEAGTDVAAHDRRQLQELLRGLPHESQGFQYVMSQCVHLDVVMKWVFRSQKSIADHLRLAQDPKDDRQTAATRRLSILWLANAIQHSRDYDAKLGLDTVLEVLVHEFRRELFRDCMSTIDRLSSAEMKHQIIAALAIKAEEIHARSRLIALGGISALIAFSKAMDKRDMTPVVQILERFMEEEQLHSLISEVGGIPILVRHLQFGKCDEYKVLTLDALETWHLFPVSSNARGDEAALKCFHDCMGPTELYKLCQIKDKIGLQARAKQLLQRLTGLVSLLLKSSDFGSLSALEIMARQPINCATIVKSGGVPTLAGLVQGSAEQLIAPSMRILANVACQNDVNRALIADTGTLSSIEKYFEFGQCDDIVEAAGMALRNLSGDSDIRTQIGLGGTLARAVTLLKKASSTRLREISAGILGNLASQNHLVNQRCIVNCNGVAALVEFAEAAANQRQRQTAMMALWVLIKDNVDAQTQFVNVGGLETINCIQQLREQLSERWACRIAEMVRVWETSLRVVISKEPGAE